MGWWASRGLGNTNSVIGPSSYQEALQYIHCSEDVMVCNHPEDPVGCWCEETGPDAMLENVDPVEMLQAHEGCYFLGNFCNASYDPITWGTDEQALWTCIHQHSEN